MTGTLVGMRCQDCGAYFWGRAVFCQNCTSGNVISVELSSSGELYSYTIVRVPPPGWRGAVPYALGQVKLPEGPHVIAEVVDCPFDQLKLGMVVELALQVGGVDEAGNEAVVYKWRPKPG